MFRRVDASLVHRALATFVALAGCSGMVRPIEANAAPSTPAVRVVRSGDYRVELDLSQQVLRLTVPEESAFGRTAGAVEEVIYPTLREVPGAFGGFAAAAVLVQKAKQFDDGLYAAVELAAQDGTGRFPAKSELLAKVARRLADQRNARDALVAVLAASRLGGASVEVPPELAASVEKAVRDGASKPIGFYTWSPKLEAIFRQDRALQRPLEGAAPQAVAAVLKGDSSLRRAYEQYLELVERLTNPFASEDLRALIGGTVTVAAQPVSFFPPSRSHEGDLVKRLVAAAPIPENFSLIDEMIRRIRAGTLKLEPTSASGWYDYQTWAHEPFVIPEMMPEARHLRFDESYRNELLDLFKGAQALARETHVKQLEIPLATSALRRDRPIFVRIAPDLAVEPLATFYERRAKSYAFVRGIVEGAFGTDGLERMQRITADGPVGTSLGRELADIEALFRGARAVAATQVGAPDAQDTGGDARRFQEWSASLASDPDLARDVRMMVPVFFDARQKKTKVWMFLGWSARTVRVEFERPPAVRILDANGRPAGAEDVRVKFVAESHTLPVPVTAEVYVKKLLNRDEFRALCDRLKTRKAILAEVGS